MKVINAENHYKGWSRFECLVLGVFVIIVGAITFPTIQSARMAARRSEYEANLKQIGLALHTYHDKYDCLPPAHVRGPDGKIWHSWRVLILPQLGYPELYDQYRFDEPWDGPCNSKLIAQNPKEYRLSYHRGNLQEQTNVLAVVGKRAAWPAEQSLRLRDFTRGTSNSILLFESDTNRVVWTSPVDLTPMKAIAAQTEQSGKYILMADGAVRFPSSEFDPKMMLAMMASNLGSLTYKGEWPADLVEDLTLDEIPPQQDVMTIHGVDITPVQNTKLSTEETLLWCSTFQMAFDQMRKELDVKELKPENPSPLIESLNKSEFPLTDLAKRNYDLHTTYDSKKLSLEVHAALSKQMPFENEFFKIEEPLTFQAAKLKQDVLSFGYIPEEGGIGEPHLVSQVQVLDYVSDDDFIIQLNTISPEHDEIILARIDAPENLAAGLQVVCERIATPNQWHDRPSLMTGDRLAIPVLYFHYQRKFGELIDQYVFADSSRLLIFKASQSIFFSLNEKGAELLSEADFGVIGEFGEEPEPPKTKPRRFIFDKPFLLILKQKDAKEPYFIGWIANTELMRKSDQ